MRRSGLERGGMLARWGRGAGASLGLLLLGLFTLGLFHWHVFYSK